MAELAPGQQTAVGLGFGHTATIVRSESDTFVVVQGPGGAPAIEVRVTPQGATVRTAASGGPSSAPPYASEPRLSVRQYASFRAECVSAPEQAAEIRERFGLAPSDEAEETEAWRRKFAAEPELFELYKRLFQQFRATPARASAPPADASQGAPLGGTLSPLLATLSPFAKSRSSPPGSAPLGLSAVLNASMGPTASSRPSAPAPASVEGRDDGSPRSLTLGEHAALAAELYLCTDREAVFRKHGLADPVVRRMALDRAEARLVDAGAHDTWKRLYALEVQKQRASAK
jgi:hypothetical protein